MGFELVSVDQRPVARFKCDSCPAVADVQLRSGDNLNPKPTKAFQLADILPADVARLDRPPQPIVEATSGPRRCSGRESSPQPRPHNLRST